MRFVAVATDYDGTLANDGQVDESVIWLLDAVRASGRRLILVTGRILPELKTVFPQLDHFDRVVAENGALLYDPATGEEQLLSEPIQEDFVRELRTRGVSPLSLGRGIVATRRPQEARVLKIIRDFGLDLRLIFNKDSVMVLPSGTDKGMGLKAALRELRISPHNVVGLGDAENDHDFLELCGRSVAVANALDAVKQSVDIVTRQNEGDGVSEILESLLADDLAEYESGVAPYRLHPQ